MQRLVHLVRRIGNRMFPMPSESDLVQDYIADAQRRATLAEACAELHEAEAKRERISAEMLRARVARMQKGLACSE